MSSIDRETVTAQQAWRRAVAGLAARFGELADPYQRARADDVRAVGDHVLAHLLGVTTSIDGDTAGVLVAYDLLPAQVAALDPARVVGIVTASGTPVSHSAILARSLGIPAVVGAGDAVLDVPDGTIILVDGSDGVVVIDPAPDVCAQSRERAADQRVRADDLLARSAPPAITTDGTRDRRRRQRRVARRRHAGRATRRRRRRPPPHRVPLPRPRRATRRRRAARHLLVDRRRARRPPAHHPHARRRRRQARAVPAFLRRGEPLPGLPGTPAQPPSSGAVQGAAAGARAARDAAPGHRPLPDGHDRRRAPGRPRAARGGRDRSRLPVRTVAGGVRGRRHGRGSRLRAAGPRRRPARRPDQRRQQRPDPVHRRRRNEAIRRWLRSPTRSTPRCSD